MPIIWKEIPNSCAEYIKFQHKTLVILTLDKHFIFEKLKKVASKYPILH